MNPFPVHSLETAPPESKPLVASVEARFGFLPRTALKPERAIVAHGEILNAGATAAIEGGYVWLRQIVPGARRRRESMGRKRLTLFSLVPAGEWRQ
jgi:hypothetical protein